MEKTSDTIINELFNSLDLKVPCVPESDNTSAYSMAESIKKHKHKSKKHKKHKKKSKKSHKKKRSLRSSSPDDNIELKLKRNKLEEAQSGMPVTLDVVMETIITTANEKIEKSTDNKSSVKESSNKDDTSIEQLQMLKNNTIETKCSVGLNNGKIIIKDLKESRLYHDLINEVQEKAKEEEAKKCEDGEHSCSSIDLDKKEKKEKHKSKKKKRSRSRNRSSTPKRHKKHKRSHSYSSRERHSRYDDLKNQQTNSRDQNVLNTKCRNKDYEFRSKDKNNHHKRSKTPDKDLNCKRRSRSRDSKKLKRSVEYVRTKKRSNSKETSNSRSRQRSPSCEKIDKKKLFKIARKNALSLVQQGVLPVGSVKKDTSANLPTKTVDELTDFCRKLSKKDKDEDGDTSLTSSDEEFKQPFHHPFLVKDRPNIVMNIRNATQLPTKSFQEKTVGQDILRQQFPVSSGQIHSLAVNEWVPLGPEESAKLNKTPRIDEGVKLTSKSHNQQAQKAICAQPIVETVPSPNNAVVPMEYQYIPPAIEPPVFVNPYEHGSLLSYETGQFTGHTGAKVLTPAELSAGYQPWVKKDQLKNSTPVNSGIGIHLLQKMGWKPGEGLGKNQSGSLEPLLLDVKMDKRGLVAEDEIQGNRVKRYTTKKVVVQPILSLEGKHPVSLLNEFCAKRKWDIPKFDTLDESGPSHRKTFIMTVVVNGVQYCSSRCQTKKLAKMDAAKTCLKEIGLLN